MSDETKLVPEEIVRLLEIDPYSRGTVRLVASGLPDSKPKMPRGADPTSYQSFIEYGRRILGLARSVLNHWTPDRVEEQALRRAADHPPASVIAQEVSVLTIAHQIWSDLLLEWAASMAQHDSKVVRARDLDSMIQGTLLALERRAGSAESRATDYRLRHQLDLIVKAVQQQELATKVGQLIETVAGAGLDETKVEKLVKDLEGATRTYFDSIKSDVTITADIVYGDWAKKELLAPPYVSKAKAAAATVLKYASIAGFKELLQRLLS